MKQMQEALDRVVAGLKEIGYEAFSAAERDHIGTIMVPVFNLGEADIEKIADIVLAEAMPVEDLAGAAAAMTAAEA